MAGGYNRGRKIRPQKIVSKSYIEPFVKKEHDQRIKRIKEVREQLINKSLEDITYKDIYEEPYRYDRNSGYVYDANNNLMFMFSESVTDSQGKLAETLLGVLNGVYSDDFTDESDDMIFSVKDGDLFVRFCGDLGDFDGDDISEFIDENGNVNIERRIATIRGWGNLTGTGVYHLPPQIAMQIQDTLMRDFTDKLNNNRRDAE